MSNRRYSPATGGRWTILGWLVPALGPRSIRCASRGDAREVDSVSPGRCSFWAGLALALTSFACAAPSWGQTAAAPVPQPDREVVGAIHRLTESARTVQDYTTIIERCATTLAAEDLATGDRDYLQKLSSWAYNRRCESRLEASEYYRDAGLSAQARGAADEALGDAIAAVERDPTRWRAWINRGVLLAQAGMLEDALRDFEKVAELQPDAAIGWYNAGEAQAALGNWSAAVDCFDHALASDPGDLQALTGRGLAHLALQQAEPALRDFELVVKFLPQSAAALLNRGDAHAALRQWREAYQDYCTAAKIAESAGSCQRAAWLLATCPEPEFFRPEGAKALAQRALQLGEPTAAAHEALAAANAALGDFAAAIEQQQLALPLVAATSAAACRKRLALYEQHQPYRR